MLALSKSLTVGLRVSRAVLKQAIIRLLTRAVLSVHALKILPRTHLHPRRSSVSSFGVNGERDSQSALPFCLSRYFSSGIDPVKHA